MRRLLIAALLAFAALAPARAEDGLVINVPVILKEAKVVFNMDHLAFDGDTPFGLDYMRILAEGFTGDKTDWQIVSVFHGAAGYMLLVDAKYNEVRNTSAGNPYKGAIAALQKAGVRFEECGETAKLNGWTNADLLAGVAVNRGANFRIVELVQSGFVQIQP